MMTFNLTQFCTQVASTIQPFGVSAACPISDSVLKTIENAMTQLFSGMTDELYQVLDSCLLSAGFRFVHEDAKRYAYITENNAFLIRHGVQFATQYLRCGSLKQALGSTVGAMTWDLEQEANRRVQLASAAAFLGFVMYKVYVDPEACLEESFELIASYAGTTLTEKLVQESYQKVIAPQMDNFRTRYPRLTAGEEARQFVGDQSLLSAAQMTTRSQTQKRK